MKQLLKFEWLTDMFSKDGQLSSKRIIGALVIMWCLGAATWLILVNSDNVHSHSMIEILCGTGASLLCAGLVEGFKGKKKDDGKSDNKGTT